MTITVTRVTLSRDVFTFTKEWVLCTFYQHRWDPGLLIPTRIFFNSIWDLRASVDDVGRAVRSLFFFFFDNLKQIPSYLSCSGPWFSTSNFFEAFTHIHYLEKSGWCSDAPRDSQHPWKKQTKSQHWNISVSNQDFSACTLWLTQSDNHSNLF